MSTNVCHCLQISATVCKCLWKSAKIWESLQTSKIINKCLQTSTNTCMCLQTSTKIYKCLRLSTNFDENLQKSANVVENLQMPANVWTVRMVATKIYNKVLLSEVGERTNVSLWQSGKLAMCRSRLVDIGEIISEPFDCITCCINIFGFWQRQLNKLSYQQPPSTFQKWKPSTTSEAKCRAKNDPFILSNTTIHSKSKIVWIGKKMGCRKNPIW